MRWEFLANFLTCIALLPTEDPNTCPYVIRAKVLYQQIDGIGDLGFGTDRNESRKEHELLEEIDLGQTEIDVSSEQRAGCSSTIGARSVITKRNTKKSLAFLK